MMTRNFSGILQHEPGPEQNVVLVRDDWEDLESTIEELIADPKKAKRIASEAKKIFSRRCLTPAAEACYRSELLRGWASVSFEPDFYEEDDEAWRGVPFESMALLGRTEWDAY